MKYLAYKLFSSLAGILGWPLFYHHLKSRGQGESFLPRLGLSPLPHPPTGSPRIWIHGVSVGEIMAAVPLAAELKILLPQCGLIISTGTETGQAVAKSSFAPSEAVVCYFPLDLPWAVHCALKSLEPHIFVALESEIWPNFLSTAKRRGIPLALVNARLSDRSFRRYLRYNFLARDVLDLFSLIAAGSEEDYRRFLGLGLSKRKLFLKGNLKVDALLGRWKKAVTSPSPPPSGNAPPVLRSNHATLFKEKLRLRGEPVFLAASTHPGEEEVVLKAYEELRVSCPTLLLILAPRHPDRAQEVGDLLSRRGHGYERWQSLRDGHRRRQQPVVLVDTVGDLFQLYAAADVAFVGGSLVPHGGQNILEAAAWGLSPLYGPYMENFRWAQDILQDHGVGATVRNSASLAAAVSYLLKNPEERHRLGEAAWAALISHQGAARRQAELVVGLVGWPI